MSFRSFKNKVAGFSKTGLLAVIIFTSTSCGSGDPNPGTEPDDTDSLKGKVYIITGKITGLDINVVDSTISIRTGGFDAPTEIILSAKKSAVGGKVDFESKGSALDEITLITKKTFEVLNPAAGLTIRSADPDKKYIGRSTEGNNDKIDALEANSSTVFGGVISGSETSLEAIKAVIKEAKILIGGTSKGVGKPQNTYIMGVTN